MVSVGEREGQRWPARQGQGVAQACIGVVPHQGLVAMAVHELKQQVDPRGNVELHLTEIGQFRNANRLLSDAPAPMRITFDILAFDDCA